MPRPKRTQPAVGEQNQLGQVIGAKGAETRRRLLVATNEVLRTTSLRDLRVAQIANQAQTSAATFYVYFNDVAEAVLALLGEHTQSPPGLLSLFDDVWSAEEGRERASEFIATYIENWRMNASLLRVRNLAADEGDWRFSEVRINAVLPLIERIAQRIEHRRLAAELPAELEPRSAASALLAMVERVAFVPLTAATRGVSRRRLLEAAVFFTVLLVGGGTLAGGLTSRRTQQLSGDLPITPPGSRPVLSASPRRRGGGLLNQQGQAMGEKGVRTRRRILEATDRLLREKAMLDLSVADIAKEAGVSATNVYLYFADASEAVLALVSELSQSTPHLMSAATAAARAKDAGGAEAFVRSYIAHSRSHGPLCRVRNIAADAGDERFIKVRAAAIEPLLNLIASQVAECQARGGLPSELHPVTTAGALLAMVERLAVTPNISPDGGINVESLSRACGYMYYVLISGVPAPR